MAELTEGEEVVQSSRSGTTSTGHSSARICSSVCGLVAEWRSINPSSEENAASTGRSASIIHGEWDRLRVLRAMGA